MADAPKDEVEEMRNATLAQAITVQAGLALQDAVAAARDAMTMRQVVFADLLKESRELPLKERLAFLKDLYSTHSDLTDRMDKVFDRVDGLRSNK